MISGNDSPHSSEPQRTRFLPAGVPQTSEGGKRHGLPFVPVPLPMGGGRQTERNGQDTQDQRRPALVVPVFSPLLGSGLAPETHAPFGFALLKDGKMAGAEAGS